VEEGTVSYQVPARCSGWRLDRFLKERIPRLSRERIQKAIATRVSLSWGAAPEPSRRVVEGGLVSVQVARDGDFEEPAPSAGIEILHEDADLLAVNKPAGLLSHPTHACRTGNVVFRLRESRPWETGAPAHRLDRETSGVLLLGRSARARTALSGQFESGRVRKTYLALVRGVVSRAAGVITLPLGDLWRPDGTRLRDAAGERPRPARTAFRLLRSGVGVSLLALRPRTGRRHQIRAHLAAIGHPILGDALYTLEPRHFAAWLRISGRTAAGARPDDPGTEEFLALLGAPRQMLHAASIVVRHPGSGAPLRVTAPLPADFAVALGRLGEGEKSALAWLGGAGVPALAGLEESGASAPVRVHRADDRDRSADVHLREEVVHVPVREGNAPQRPVLVPASVAVDLDQSADTRP